MNTLSEQFCSNPYLNEVLAQYSERLEELGVKCKVDIKVAEEELPYRELCKILSNGLDNACETLKESDIENREISVQMKYNRNYLLIRVRNRCRNDLRMERWGDRECPWDQEENGGEFGLAMVKEMVGQLGGDMFYYIENGDFVLDVMISSQSFLKKIASDEKKKTI